MVPLSPIPAGAQPDRLVEQNQPVRTGSLRRRVTVATLALLTIVLVIAGVLIHSRLASQLRSDLQSRLADRADFAAVLNQQGVRGQSLANATTGAGVESVVVQGDQTYRGQDLGSAPGKPGGPPEPGGRPRPEVAPAISLAESNGVLTATITLDTTRVTLSADERQIDFTLAELRKIELIAGAVVVVVTAGLLWLVVGGSLRPLGRMTGVARSIRDGARGRRLRPTRPRTDLGRTATAFDEMLDALEAAEWRAQQAEDRMRQFLADASHDLRTPIAGVIAGSERLLLDENIGRPEREQRTLDVIRQARRAARLVDDVMLVTRLEASPQGRPARELDLAGLVRQEVDAARTRSTDGRPEIGWVEPAGVARVLGDADSLRRAVSNLLDNALRFAADRVEVHLGSDGRMLTVTIADDGPGVPADQRRRIFERFVRLDAARQGEGSGLGLPIAASIATQHGGSLEYRENPRGGACLVLRLPVAGRSADRDQGAVDPLRSS
ncbi:HAMP domain-containing sensor histidine kinase [Nakamurella sp. A5-74]|uniref:histidine kinase n=1 Tax=Nakamurella sp. A5-74 TaxID=3158264 RepID=A0AAU8DNU7_9ACTN